MVKGLTDIAGATARSRLSPGQYLKEVLNQRTKEPIMNTAKNPRWWDKSDDSAWERVKAAFKRDWDQTRHDLGADIPDTDQDVGDTVAQAAGRDPIPPRGTPTYEEAERAYRLGYGAKRHYANQYHQWDDRLESELRREWGTMGRSEDWPLYRGAVRRGWEYQG
jgi:hypothetical protein